MLAAGDMRRQCTKVSFRADFINFGARGRRRLLPHADIEFRRYADAAQQGTRARQNIFATCKSMSSLIDAAIPT